MEAITITIGGSRHSEKIGVYGKMAPEFVYEIEEDFGQALFDCIRATEGGFNGACVIRGVAHSLLLLAEQMPCRPESLDGRSNLKASLCRFLDEPRLASQY